MTARVIHLKPVRGSWQLLREGAESSQTFSTLGLALDAATNSREPLRIVVHASERKIA